MKKKNLMQLSHESLLKIGNRGGHSRVTLSSKDKNMINDTCLSSFKNVKRGGQVGSNLVLNKSLVLFDENILDVVCEKNSHTIYSGVKNENGIACSLFCKKSSEGGGRLSK